MDKDNVLSMIIHGSTKAGKSTLTSTAPTPILVIDAEGSWKFIRQVGFKSGIPLRKISWNPAVAPPRHDGTWDVCHVIVSNWEQMTQIYAWLTQTQHDFTSIVLDSITELQRRLKRNISSDGVIKGYDGWGRMLADMETMLLGFRDLTLAPGPVRCVLYVAETRMENGKWRPYMQGQIGSAMPYWVDICGYLYQTMENDSNGNQTVKTVNLFVGTHPQFESGERVQGAIPDLVTNPNITEIMSKIHGEETAQ